MTRATINRRTFLATAGVVRRVARTTRAAPRRRTGVRSTVRRTDARRLVSAGGTGDGVSSRGRHHRGGSRVELSNLAAIGHAIRELRLPLRVLPEGLDELRHLPPRSRAWPEYVGGDEDQHLPQNDREPSARVVGSIFPLVRARAVNVKNQGSGTPCARLMDWPRLRSG